MTGDSVEPSRDATLSVRADSGSMTSMRRSVESSSPHTASTSTSSIQKPLRRRSRASSGRPLRSSGGCPPRPTPCGPCSSVRRERRRGAPGVPRCRPSRREPGPTITPNPARETRPRLQPRLPRYAARWWQRCRLYIYRERERERERRAGDGNRTRVLSLGRAVRRTMRTRANHQSRSGGQPHAVERS